MSLEAIVWKEGNLKIIDQLLLPTETVWLDVNSVEDGWQVINKMQVRGAPAIACVGCLSLASELYRRSGDEDLMQLVASVEHKLKYLVSARPTAVNMRNAARDINQLCSKLAASGTITGQQLRQEIINFCTNMMTEDVATNKSLSEYGAEYILKNIKSEGLVKVLTICNTGSLATCGYGTALGVVRSLAARNRLEEIFMCETRPALQGARLSAFEAVVEKWPNANLICDGAVAHKLSQSPADVVLVGADRVAANGDTANKIGTYQLALLCKQFSIPFFVCSPISSVDFDLPKGSLIPIEHRPPKEMMGLGGRTIAPEGIGCYNPVFDVTPAELITGGIITEKGVFKPQEIASLKL